MGIRVDVLPLDVNTPGHGMLRIAGWEGSSEGLQCSLQSNQTQDFLHEGGRWSNVAHWFRLEGMTAVEGGSAIETRIGPNLVNPLLQASGTSAFRIEVSNPATGESAMHMVRLSPTLVASADLGPAMPAAPEPEAVMPVAPPAPEPVVAPEPEPVVSAVIEPQAQPEPVAAVPPAPSAPPAPAKSGNRWLLPLILLLLIAAAAVAAWWWFTQRPQPAPVEPPAAEQPAAPVAQPASAAAAPCTLESMQGQAELAFVQSCIQQAPDSAKLLEVINTAKANNHCGVAQRLYANRAQGGDVQIAMAYAHEYDPKYHQASECFKAPDNATAAYWYETILGFDENNAEAKARFEELKP